MLFEGKMLAEEGRWCRSSKSCGRKSLAGWGKVSVWGKLILEENCFWGKTTFGGKLAVSGKVSVWRKKIVEKTYLVEEKQLVEEKVWIGRACISHIVSSQPLVSASWSSPRLFAAFFRLIQSDKTFAVFGFGKLLFFHIFLPALLVSYNWKNLSEAFEYIPIANTFLWAISKCSCRCVCGLWKSSPQEQSPKRIPYTLFWRGNTWRGELGGLIISCGMCGFPVPQQ